MNWKNLKRKASHLTAPLALAAAIASPKPSVAQASSSDSVSDVFLRSTAKILAEANQNQEQTNSAEQQTADERKYYIDLGSVPVGYYRDIPLNRMITIPPNVSLDTRHSFVEFSGMRGRDAKNFFVISDLSKPNCYNCDTSTEVTVPDNILIRFTPNHAGPEFVILHTCANTLSRGGCIIMEPDTVFLFANRGPDDTAYIFIGGAMDKSDSHIVEDYMKDIHSENPGSSYSDPNSSYARYFTWDEEADILGYIKILPTGTRINIIGHSWGGDTALDVVTESEKPINDLVTIDPVGGWDNSPGDPSAHETAEQYADRLDTTMRARYAAIKSKVNLWIDVDAEPTTTKFSDVVAGMGKAWNRLPEGQATIFIPATNIDHGQFDLLMQAIGGKGPTGSNGRSAQQILKGP